MDKETYEALKDIISSLKYSNETNDFSKFILDADDYYGYIQKLENWIDKVEKEYN